MKDISEATAPAEIHKQMLECNLQGQCVRWYKDRASDTEYKEDYRWARKFSSISQRSVPDFLFSRFVRVVNKGPSRTKFACEFKKPGTKKKYLEKHNVWVMSTQAQYEEQIAMRLAGWFVFECDNFEVFKKTVLAYEQEQS